MTISTTGDTQPPIIVNVSNNRLLNIAYIPCGANHTGVDVANSLSTPIAAPTPHRSNLFSRGLMRKPKEERKAGLDKTHLK